MFRREKIVDLFSNDILGHEILCGDAHFPDMSDTDWRRWYRQLADAAPHLEDVPGLLFLNLSSAQVMDADIVASIRRFPMRERMVLEWTEDHHPTHNMRQVIRAFHGLREVGYRLAVDDVGAGMDGIGRVAACRPEFAKIDGPLLHRARSEPEGASMLLGLKLTLEALGASVISEWVETEQDRMLVRAAGISLGQGYLFQDQALRTKSAIPLGLAAG